ncbi:hypothetical protein [Phyllobacterium chamaecytisi]|uniref:hypothetical protein n=1 Tax=Phyllobacterium chamaecytisi TaxID=2876082 RepID=UPI001CCC275E|nr:hypothetical protein [Phyllobacterium sp. KW56]MBZ9600497.1 hypothetical protein [Phyllobacterium sp. KW56]
MSLLKQKTVPFVVPSLADADPAYAELVAKQRDLLDQQAKFTAERVGLVASIRADTSREVDPKVAALLGDPVSGKATSRQRVGEIDTHLKTIANALEIIRIRLADARSKASLAVCAKVKPEYARRVKAMAEALEQVQVARAHYDELRSDLDANDVSWGSLVPMTPAFLGDYRDGHVPRWLGEAKRAGY